MSAVRNKVLSFYIVISLLMIGFIGFLVIEDILSDCDASAATTRYVGGTGPGNYSTIQNAIDNANSGDTIRVYSGTYYESIDISKNLIMIGNGSANTTIDAGWSKNEVVMISSNDVNISGFRIINGYYGIYIDSVNYVHVFDNNVTSNYFGIYLWGCRDNIIENNNCDGNTREGIYLYSSTSNEINNNSASYSNYGINIYYSDSNTIKNNTCIDNNYIGIYISDSSSDTLRSNKLTNCGIVIYGWQVSYWNAHVIDATNTVNGRPVYYYKNLNSGSVPAGAGQVIIVNCKNIVVENQNLSNASCGMAIVFSDHISFKNSSSCWNLQGLYLFNSDYNIISNNNLSFSTEYNIFMVDANYNLIEKNICSNSNYNGIYLDRSNSNELDNNTIKKSQGSGIEVYYSELNNFTYNNMLSNNRYGIWMMSESDNNILRNNNISKNNDGIYITWESSRNSFFKNTISNNINIGVDIDSRCSNNKIYHNNFISNPTQARDAQGNNNQWYLNSEGNYWDDYNGIDNGAGGRLRGDGIGDTNLPHLNLDRYPFVNRSGWLYPGIPTIIDPGEIDSDGNFSITWNNNRGTTGYVLEEDDNNAFDSPIEIYDGAELDFKVTNRSEGVYYYRIKAYNELHESVWSKDVDMIVDYLPRIPVGFRVIVNPAGNALSLVWDQNTVDTNDYDIFYKTIEFDPWEELATVAHPGFSYNHTGLVDGAQYYYCIRARDGRNQSSNLSEAINGTPWDSLPPTMPTGLGASALSDSEIYLTWKANIEPDLAGYHIFMHDPEVDEPGIFHREYTLTEPGTSYTVSGLTEQVNYQFKISAFDEVPNNSTFSDIVTTFPPDETPPRAPTELNVDDPTNNSLNLSWSPSSDTDVIGYFIFRSLSLSGPDILVNAVPINKTEYMDVGLQENTLYYYKLKAIDDANFTSKFSDFAYGITELSNYPPEINNTIADFELEEDTVDKFTVNLYYLFKDVNSDSLQFRCEGAEYINVTIDEETGQVELIPELDWNGEETLTFYAEDAVGEVSFKITITVTEVNDPPGPAYIIKPDDGIEIVFGDLLDFEGVCGDSDTPYGDELTFRWYLDGMDELLGMGEQLDDIYLALGEHTITLEVTDITGESAQASIKVNVMEKTKDSDGKGSDYATILIIIVVIVIILVLLSLWFLIKNKKLTFLAKKEEKPEPQAEQIPTLPAQQFPQSQVLYTIPAQQPPGLPPPMQPPLATVPPMPGQPMQQYPPQQYPAQVQQVQQVQTQPQLPPVGSENVQQNATKPESTQ